MLKTVTALPDFVAESMGQFGGFVSFGGLKCKKNVGLLALLHFESKEKLSYIF